MKQWLLGALSLLALLMTFEASACPLCLAFKLSITAQDLVYARRAVLALPEIGGARFRVVEVIKGEGPPDGTIAESVFRGDSVASNSTRPLLLLRHDSWASWVNFGAIGAEHTGWLRQLAATKSTAEMTGPEWREHVAFLLPYLENPEPLVAEIAYGELASAPYDALRSLKPQLDAEAIRKSTDDLRLSTRQPLYNLLLGIAGGSQDAERLERRLDASWRAKDPTNVGPMLAADLELRGAARMAWIERKYLLDRDRSAPQIQSALLALSVQGNANAAVPRARVIQAYRRFIKNHKPLAGLVSVDLADWNCWDVLPEYLALLKSGSPQDPASRYAILIYVQRSRSADAQTALKPLPGAPLEPK